MSEVMKVPSLEIFNGLGERMGILKVDDGRVKFTGDFELAAQVFFERVVKPCIDTGICDMIIIKDDDEQIIYNFKLVDGQIVLEGNADEFAAKMFERLRQLASEYIVK